VEQLDWQKFSEGVRVEFCQPATTPNGVFRERRFATAEPASNPILGASGALVVRRLQTAAPWCASL